MKVPKGFKPKGSLFNFIGSRKRHARLSMDREGEHPSVPNLSGVMPQGIFEGTLANFLRMAEYDSFLRSVVGACSCFAKPFAKAMACLPNDMVPMGPLELFFSPTPLPRAGIRRNQATSPQGIEGVSWFLRQANGTPSTMSWKGLWRPERLLGLVGGTGGRGPGGQHMITMLFVLRRRLYLILPIQILLIEVKV